MLIRSKPHGRANAMLSSTHPSWLSTNVARSRAMEAGLWMAGGSRLGHGGVWRELRVQLPPRPMSHAKRLQGRAHSVLAARRQPGRLVPPRVARVGRQRPQMCPAGDPAAHRAPGDPAGQQGYTPARAGRRKFPATANCPSLGVGEGCTSATTSATVRPRWRVEPPYPGRSSTTIRSPALPDSLDRHGPLPACPANRCGTPREHRLLARKAQYRINAAITTGHLERNRRHPRGTLIHGFSTR